MRAAACMCAWRAALLTSRGGGVSLRQAGALARHACEPKVTDLHAGACESACQVFSATPTPSEAAAGAVGAWPASNEVPSCTALHSMRCALTLARKPLSSAPEAACKGCAHMSRNSGNQGCRGRLSSSMSSGRTRTSPASHGAPCEAPLNTNQMT